MFDMFQDDVVSESSTLHSGTYLNVFTDLERLETTTHKYALLFDTFGGCLQGLVVKDFRGGLFRINGVPVAFGAHSHAYVVEDFLNRGKRDIYNASVILVSCPSNESCGGKKRRRDRAIYMPVNPA
jgi:hypothetical protein